MPGNETADAKNAAPTLVTDQAAAAPAAPTIAADPAKGVPEAAKSADAAGKSVELAKTETAKAEAPVVYDLKAPEGYQGDVAALTAFAKEQGITPAAAQKLLEREAGMAQAFQQQAAEALREQSRTTWVESVKNDPEIGGAKFASSVETAKRFITTFGSEQLKKTLDETGLGNHPELIRVFAKAGAAMRDDALLTTNSTAAGPKTLADTLYPNMKKG